MGFPWGKNCTIGLSWYCMWRNAFHPRTLPGISIIMTAFCDLEHSCKLRWVLKCIHMLMTVAQVCQWFTISRLARMSDLRELRQTAKWLNNKLFLMLAWAIQIRTGWTLPRGHYKFSGYKEVALFHLAVLLEWAHAMKNEGFTQGLYLLHMARDSGKNPQQ